MAQSCRRIATHRATLQRLAVRKCALPVALLRGSRMAHHPWRPAPAGRLLDHRRCPVPKACLAPARHPFPPWPRLPPHLCVPRRSEQSCCGSIYIPRDPPAPSQLAPWEWTLWLEMCKGSGDIEAALSERPRRAALSPHLHAVHTFPGSTSLVRPEAASRLCLLPPLPKPPPAPAEKMGLIKMEAKETVAMRIAVSRPSL